MQNSKLSELKEIDRKLNTVFETITWSDENTVILEGNNQTAVMHGLLKLREIAVSVVHANKGTHAEHTHEEHEWFFIIDGSLKIIMNNTEHILKPGEFLEIPCNTIHEPVWLEESLILAITMPSNKFFPKGGPSWQTIMGHLANGDD